MSSCKCETCAFFVEDKDVDGLGVCANKSSDSHDMYVAYQSVCGQYLDYSECNDPAFYRDVDQTIFENVNGR